MNLSLSFQGKLVGVLELNTQEYKVDAISVLKHRTLLKKILHEVYTQGLVDQIQGNRAIEHVVLPGSAEFLSLLVLRLTSLGYEVA